MNRYELERREHNRTKQNLHASYARNQALRKTIDSSRQFLDDLLSLDPSLERFKTHHGDWDYEGVAAAAKHKRDRERLARFAAGKVNPEAKDE